MVFFKFLKSLLNIDFKGFIKIFLKKSKMKSIDFKGVNPPTLFKIAKNFTFTLFLIICIKSYKSIIYRNLIKNDKK